MFGTALALLMAVVALAHAAEPIWLEPHEAGVVALYDDGAVVRRADDPTHATFLARAWQSDRLVVCSSRVYGVDGTGHVAVAAPGGAVGPLVSPHADLLCLADGDLLAVAAEGDALLRLSTDLEVRLRAPVDALPDTELVPVGDAVAYLAGPTFRYRHGVLGDELEASAVEVLDVRTLQPRARWEVSAEAVIEQRGLEAVPLWSDASGAVTWGLIVTRSAPGRGAQPLVLTLRGGQLREFATGPAIGRSNRWLHVFGADRDSAWSVRTPHLGGPLVRWRLPNAPVTGDGVRDAELAGEDYALGVTSHVLGSRNLDQAQVLPDDPTRPGVDLLVLPRQDLRALRVVRCAARCQVTVELPLSGRLTTNLVAVPSPAGTTVFAGDDSGVVHRFPLDVRGELRR